jgi:hypothetical protein
MRPCSVLFWSCLIVLLGSFSLLRAAPAASYVYLPAIQSQPPWWQPAPGVTWQVQFADLPIDQTVDAEAYDIDLFDTDAATVAQLHAQRRRVVCYVNAGAWESWRPDAAQFPDTLLGDDYDGWPGERWLDIRQLDVLAPILRQRLDLCKAKGFDAVEPDNIDGYKSSTGFPLTAADQLAYNRWLAQESHARGLSIGLKNDLDQVQDLVAQFDWALTENCFKQGWCDQLQPFIVSEKAVFVLEYTNAGMSLDQLCPAAHQLRVSAILKNRSLDAYREAC